MSAKPLKKKRRLCQQLTQVGHLANPTYAVHQPQLHEMQAAAWSLGTALHPFEVREESEIPQAFAGMAAATWVRSSCNRTHARRPPTIALAAQHRLPGMYIASYYTDDGGLIPHGTHHEDSQSVRRHVRRQNLEKGRSGPISPSSVPVLVRVVINLKTAKALGFTFPAPLLFQATSG